jgi:hypothetical protein
MGLKKSKKKYQNNFFIRLLSLHSYMQFNLELLKTCKS